MKRKSKLSRWTSLNGFSEKGETNPNVNKEAVAIMCSSENQAPTTAKVSISVMENMENSCFTRIYKKRLIDHTFPSMDSILDGTCVGYGFHYLLSHQELKDNARLLSNGALRLLIKMTVFGEEKTTWKPVNYDSQNTGTIDIQQRLKVFKRIRDKWTDDNLSDVHVKCGGQSFYCHRMILVSSSQYFGSILDRWMECGLTKGETRVIDLEYMDVDVLLEHMDVDVLKAILKFIYGGEIYNLETNAVDLMKAAEMLIMEDLKSICEKYLLANYIKLRQ